MMYSLEDMKQDFDGLYEEAKVNIEKLEYASSKEELAEQYRQMMFDFQTMIQDAYENISEE